MNLEKVLHAGQPVEMEVNNDIQTHIQMSRHKNPLTFHYTGCLLGIVCNGLLIILIYLGIIIPYIYPKQPVVFFHCSHKDG